MDAFISVCPDRKPPSCLEYLRKFSGKELQGILKHYHENISGEKADLLMRTFAIFSHCQPKLQSQQLPSDSFLDHTTCCTYKTVFFVNFEMQFGKMISEKYQILTFFSYTIILLLLLRNIMVICYKELLIKN